MQPSTPIEEPLTGGIARSNHRVRERIGPAIAVPVLLGLVAGFAAPVGERPEPEPWDRVSLVAGWVAFFAWSTSFYLQIVLNFQRRSVVGVSLDYWLLNVAGFACYFAFNATLLWHPGVQQEYREAHGGQSSAVRLSDVLFAGNALATSAFIVLQIAIFYDYPPLDRADRLVRVVIFSAVALLAVVSGVAGVVIWQTSEGALTWLTYLQSLAEVKVLVSVVKYCPQVWLIFRRKSTEGWSMGNVFLDFTGGLLTVAQLLIDSWSTNDWSAATGDLPKLLLGNVSMLFDVVFMVQHFWLYPADSRKGSRAGL